MQRPLIVITHVITIPYKTQTPPLVTTPLIPNPSTHRETPQMGTHRPHFLIVTFPVQSHINPALHLARRLISSTDALVTFSTAESAHRRMFPDTAPASDGNLIYAPYPDGYEARGFKPKLQHEPDSLKISDSDDSGSDNVDGFASILLSLAASGRRVTCVVYTLLLTWAADVARAHGVPSAQYWIQPATVFVAYYHYFHGYESLINNHRKDPRFSVELPGLPPMQIRDLPSFLTSATSDDGPYSMILPRFRESFEKLEPGAKILMNTFDELESEALASIERVNMVPIGPILSPDKSEHDLVKCDGRRYMEWLDSKQGRSVVYVSFGSISVITKAQMEEISRGLRASGRPYLWVVRNDCRHEGVELEEDGEENAMVVEWCSQVRVLNHPSVGCFVTHCGWNSTTESLVAGVPTVGVPQWTDQVTNAMLMEKEWGMGVRGESNEDGVLEGEELRRCLDLVMGEGERGREIRRNAEVWSEKAREAVGEGGSSDRNLRAFVAEIVKSHQNFL